MKPKGLFVLDNYACDVIYGPDERADIARIIDIYAPHLTNQDVQANRAALRDAEVIFSGWGGPKMDDAFLAAAPRLRAVFYGAGSIKGIVSDAFWARGIVLTSAYGANAIPVAEYALSQILFCLKRGWHYALAAKRDGKYPPREEVPGAYGRTVGIISLGMVGRRVCELLGHFDDLHVLAYDPFADQHAAARLGVELCSLDDIFRRADVASLHTPWLKETEGMIAGAHFALMKPNASFINTSRGAIVRENEMIDVLRRRPDLQVVLDVTWPEPPEPNSPLWTLPNVALTPHIAGSMDRECRRMGRAMIDECERFLRGEKLKWNITKDMVPRLG